MDVIEHGAYRGNRVCVLTVLYISKTNHEIVIDLIQNYFKIRV
jgi:hypothetical protein